MSSGPQRLCDQRASRHAERTLPSDEHPRHAATKSSLGALSRTFRAPVQCRHTMSRSRATIEPWGFVATFARMTSVSIPAAGADHGGQKIQRSY
jgi:hypothetical protein